MKVILLKDVPRIGRKYDVKDVPDGYALNMLIPQSLALRATEKAVARIERERSSHEKELAEAEAKFQEMLSKLSGEKITLSAEANEQGGLFRGLHADDIAEALKQKGTLIEERQIILEEAIKTVGPHTVKLASGAHEGVITIHVEPA